MAKVLLIIVCLSVIGYGLAHSRRKPSPKAYSRNGYTKFGKTPTTHSPQAEEYCVGKFFCGLDRIPNSAIEECVSGGKVCDGHRDCRNGADERYCAPFCHDQFLCHDRKTCAKPCDGIMDCPSGEDEVCPDSCHCAEGTFKCPNEDLCLPASKACDGQSDCLDGSDENDCSAACKCGAGNYLCKNEAPCIKPNKFCDGDNNCELEDDEASCPSTCFCAPGDYICRTFGSINPKCIPKGLLCNGAENCPQEEDEALVSCV